jgi:transposase
MMSKKNRYYPPEFKREALKLLATTDQSMAKLERELGITPGLLRQWKRQARIEGHDLAQEGEGKPVTLASAKAQNRQLKKENARLRQEREILKKAMAIFSSPKQ